MSATLSAVAAPTAWGIVVAMSAGQVVHVFEPKSAVRYRCECGTEYLVALQDECDEAWLAAVGDAAQAIGLAVVDGSQATFVCKTCGVWHERTNDGAALARVVGARARAAAGATS